MTRTSRCSGPTRAIRTPSTGRTNGTPSRRGPGTTSSSSAARDQTTSGLPASRAWRPHHRCTSTTRPSGHSTSRTGPTSTRPTSSRTTSDARSRHPRRRVAPRSRPSTTSRRTSTTPSGPRSVPCRVPSRPLSRRGTRTSRQTRSSGTASTSRPGRSSPVNLLRRRPGSGPNRCRPRLRRPCRARAPPYRARVPRCSSCGISSAPRSLSRWPPRRRRGSTSRTSPEPMMRRRPPRSLASNKPCRSSAA